MRTLTAIGVCLSLFGLGQFDPSTALGQEPAANPPKLVVQSGHSGQVDLRRPVAGRQMAGYRRRRCHRPALGNGDGTGSPRFQGWQGRNEFGTQLHFEPGTNGSSRGHLGPMANKS